jgi:hypothetical protein
VPERVTERKFEGRIRGRAAVEGVYGGGSLSPAAEAPCAAEVDGFGVWSTMIMVVNGKEALLIERARRRVFHAAAAAAGMPFGASAAIQ